MRDRLIVAVIPIMIMASSCIKPPEYPIEPHIKFVTINQTEFIENDSTPIRVTIYFEDGDGDLGGLEIDSLNMFWEDSRIPGFPVKFKIPFIELQGNHDDISGSIYVERNVSECIGLGIETDTLFFSIWIEDRAEHASNIIKTPEIVITECN